MEGLKPSQRGQGGRERLLATARDLFTRHGAANVGINDVTACAGVARMTLYNNFPSKEALTLAVYKEMVEETLDTIRTLDTVGMLEEERVLAIFDHFDRAARNSDHRGCPFVHASLQTMEPNGPIYALVQSYKRALREHILTLLEETRSNRGEIADAILILLDGAVIEAYVKSVANSSRSAKYAAEILLKSIPASPDQQVMAESRASQ